MNEHPVLIPTIVGATGGMVTEPAGEWRAASILLPGAGGPGRSGINAFWARTARTLAALGVVSLRYDYAHFGNGSTMLSPKAHRQARERNEHIDIIQLREVAAWLRERVGDLGLLLAGDCHGGRMAIELLPHDRDVAGVFAVVPYLRNGFVPPAVRESRGPLEGVDILDEVRLDGLRNVLDRGRPAWLLVGEGDGDDAFRLRRVLGAAGRRLEIDVVPDRRLHPVAAPEIQQLIGLRLVERISSALERKAVAVDR